MEPTVQTRPLRGLLSGRLIERVRPFSQVSRAWTCAVTSAFVTFLAVNLLFTVWVHHAFEGRYEGPFLISAHFGVPTIEEAHGIAPVMPEEIPGWDGQFYYHIANDPLALEDTALHLDNPSYRYQRIGVPALAWLTSRAMGQSFTTAWAYHQVQIILISLGMGAIVFWLIRHGLSAWWAYVWLGASGPLYTLAHGLPDAAGDGVFALTLCLLWYRRLGGYALAASLLVLIREGYVVIPFMVFLMTAINRFRWQRLAPLAEREARSLRRAARSLHGQPSSSKRVILTALPGVLLLGWMGYLWAHFGVEPWSEQRSPGGLYSWPFLAAWQTIKAEFHSSNAVGVAYPLLCAATIAVVGISLVQCVRRSPIFIIVSPYVLLCACLGSIIWMAPEGYMKAVSAVVLIGLFLLPYQRGVLLPFILLANLVVGIHWNLIRSTVAAPWFSPHMSLMDSTAAPKPAVNDPLTNFHAPVRWLDESSELRPSYQGIWREVHREAVPLDVEIPNHTGQTWQPSEPGSPHAILIGHVWFRDNVPVDGHKVPIKETWKPGETRRVRIWVRLGKPGYYLLQLSMYQEGVGWFFQHDPRGGGRYPVRVK